MRIIRGTGIDRRGGFGPLAVFFLLLVTAVFQSPVSAGQIPEIRLIYFFSSSCKHCAAAKTSVIELSREFPLEGLHVGPGPSPAFPFPVKEGDRKISRELYGVFGVPAIAVMVDGRYKQMIAGADDIRDAKAVVKALAGGAKTVSEAAETDQETDITITGWIVARGKYFKSAQFFITDRKTELPLKAWLPLEAVKGLSPGRRPRLMTDVVNKPVVLRGSIKRMTDGPLFLVKEEELLNR